MALEWGRNGMGMGNGMGWDGMGSRVGLVTGLLVWSEMGPGSMGPG